MKTKKRVALINPPSPFLMNERVTANTGVLHVATEMRNNGIDVFQVLLHNLVMHMSY